MKKSSKKKVSRRPLMRRADRKTMKESLAFVALVLLMVGFLLNPNSLVGIGLVVLIIYFMVRK